MPGGGESDGNSRDAGNARPVGQPDNRASKVIDLHGYKAAERALDDLLAADPASPAFAKLLAQCASLGSPLLAAMGRRISAARPRELHVLGRLLSTVAPRSDAIQAMERVVADRRNCDEKRLGAAMVLDHFLGAPPAPDFLATLRDPLSVAANSLLALLIDESQSRSQLHRQIRALLEQPVELIAALLNLLGGGTPLSTRRALLQVLALHSDPAVMAGAIEAITELPQVEAAKALSILEPSLRPNLAHKVGRTLQKWRLSGAMIPETPDRAGSGLRAERPRALVSPVDGHGDRLLLFVVPAPDASAAHRASLLTVIKELTGIDDAVGDLEVVAGSLPPPGAIGATYGSSIPSRLHPRAGPGADSTSGPLLEVPYAYGLELLGEAVRSNWATGNPLPLDYLLFFDLVWAYSAKKGGKGGKGEQERAAARGSPPPRAAQANGDLLSHPLLESWYLDSPALRGVAAQLAPIAGDVPSQLTDQGWRVLLPAVIRLAHEEFTPPLRARYAARLRKMADWFRIAGQQESAGHASEAADAMLQSPPEANLFALRLVQRGIIVALQELGGAGAP